MNKRIYNKAPLSFDEQLSLMKKRGLTVDNEEKAISYLKSISYYRLSAYFLPYQSDKDKFNEGTTFKQIIRTYTFDRELRLLIFDCIERIEVAIRTQFIYTMSLTYNDAHWHDQKHYFIDPYDYRGEKVDPHKDLQDIIDRAKRNKRREVFITHYMDTYSNPANPPSWMCLELLTIGELSHTYKGLANNDDKKRIADFFGVHYEVFGSWLHTLTYVRNLCAHHSRLWNRDLAIVPKKLIKPQGPWLDKSFENNKRVFYFINILKYLLDRANPGNNLRNKIELLFDKYPTIPIQYLGIPSDGRGNLLDWKKQPIWK